MNEILVTCLKSNKASRKVIEKNGGKFEREFYDEKANDYIERFWINNGLNDSSNQVLFG